MQTQNENGTNATGSKGQSNQKNQQDQTHKHESKTPKAEESKPGEHDIQKEPKADQTKNQNEGKTEQKR